MRLTVKRLVLFGLLAGFPTLFTGCEQSAPVGPPRLVVLYATCSLNKDFLSPYDTNIAYTPALNGFASAGRVFERHQTEAGQSGIAFASLFTGTQATEHGIFRHPTRLPDESLTISEAFAAAGYDTHAWLDHRMASAELGYAQGVPARNAYDGKILPDDARLAKVLDRLAQEPDYKAFILVNFTVTHGPYRGTLIDEFCRLYPAECDARSDEAEFERYRKLYRESFLDWSFDFADTAAAHRLGAREIERFAATIELLYKADVHLLDRMFGNVLAAVERRDLMSESLIAFTADHGEVQYRDHARFFWTHGWQLAPEVLNVAFVLYGPGAGVRTGVHEGVTRSIDVFPTLAGLAGLELPEIPGLGVDLSTSVREESPEPDLLAFSHTALFTDEVWHRYQEFPQLARLYEQDDPDLIWTAVREGDMFYKLERPDGTAWEPRAFDLAVDPDESRNLFDDQSATHRERAKQLADYRMRLAERFRMDSGGTTIDSERSTELLRHLGYIE